MNQGPTKRVPAARLEKNRRLAADFRRGRRPALARAISMVEASRPGVADLLGELLMIEPRARRIGITGPPGAGKSSLAALLAKLMRKAGEEVAIVAVDPTSPFTGGALLGDRIRMNDLAVDPGIFIRSMATRGSLGGLAAATREVIDLLDAFGFPNIIIETVGVGQTQLEIQAAADTTVVVLVPESGDGVQAMKAGLMEIADVFVVNKSDRIGADRLVREISQALMLKAGLASKAGLAAQDAPAHHGVDLSRIARRPGTASSGPAQGDASGPSAPAHGPAAASQGHAGAPRWEIPVLKTSAGRGEGIDELLGAILAHGRWLRASGTLEARRERRALSRIRDVVERRLRRRAERFFASDPRLAQRVMDVKTGRATAYGVADRIMPAILKEVPESSSRVPESSSRAVESSKRAPEGSNRDAED